MRGADEAGHAIIARGRAAPGWRRWPLLTVLVGAVFVAAQVVLSVAYAPRMPERMATHFDLAGRPNGWMARRLALLMGPLIAAGVAALLAVAPGIRRSGGPGAHLLAAPAVLVQAVLLAAFWWMYGRNARGSGTRDSGTR